MWLFGKTKTNHIPEMRQYLKNYMLQYVKDHPDLAHDAVPIFSDAELVLRKLTEKQVEKMLNADNMCIESAMLNILQNTCTLHFKKKTTKEILLSSIDTNKDVAFELYNEINDIKLNKGYINKQQHEENNLVAIQLTMR